MKQSINTWSSFYVKATLFILLILSTVIFVRAQNVTFAQFIERNGSQDFVFASTPSVATFQTIADGSPIYFVYQNVPMLPADLQGPQLAHIYLSATTTSPAIQVAGDPPRDIQRFNGTVTIQIIRDTPSTGGTGSQRNLLTMVINPNGAMQSSLAGDNLGDVVTYTASEPEQIITVSSDFLGFTPGSQESVGLTFSSVNPPLTIGPGGFLNIFTAAGVGTFGTSMAPIYSPPTAAAVTINGRVFSAYGRPVSGAIVSLTDQSGATTIAGTNSLGYFRFVNIPAGQIVTVSVTAKGGTYAPRVINLTDNIDELNFYPVP
jgi:hypothetical protein